MEVKIKITNNCTLCLECVEACTSDIITEDLLQIAVDNDGIHISTDKCRYEEYCANACPEDAITIERIG